MNNVIELKNVEKVYKLGVVDVPALREVNLKIKEGEFLAITGASGSGKSTLMHMVGCLDVPTKGKVFLNNSDITQLTESQLAQIRGKKIGFVFQTFNLIPSLNALENVVLPMIFQKVSKDVRVKKAMELLESVGLGERIKHRPSELSGGERQRVAVARALANEPDVILADEPTGNLDSKAGTEIMEIIEKLNKKENKTIVIVTHEKYIANYAKKTIHLKDGMIVG